MNLKIETNINNGTNLKNTYNTNLEESKIIEEEINLIKNITNNIEKAKSEYYQTLKVFEDKVSNKEINYKIAYLTFDDGPSANITPQVLDILKAENVPATFFLVGARVKLYPELVKRAYEEGHYLANHGYTHEYSKIYQSADTIFAEYIDCENAVREAVGITDYRMFLFRYPGGSSGGRYNKIKNDSKEILNSYSVAHTNWNCMTGDAEGKDTYGNCY
jgi:peptidoglycan/xylan/chitin deacetylase (PgdA/CDA1 family)